MPRSESAYDLLQRDPGTIRKVFGPGYGTSNSVSAPAAPFQPRLPKPISWDPSKLSSLPKPSTWWEQMVDYCTAMHWSIPTHLQWFLESDSLDWFHHLRSDCTARGEPLTADKLRTDFMHQYAKTLHSDEVEARKTLFNGDITLGKCGSFQAYELSFAAIRRDLPNMHQTDLVYWFLFGLSPALRTTCAVQPITNLDWTDLSSLMIYAKGEAIRMEAKSTSVHVATAVTALREKRRTKFKKLHTKLRKALPGVKPIVAAVTAPAPTRTARTGSSNGPQPYMMGNIEMPRHVIKQMRHDGVCCRCHARGHMDIAPRGSDKPGCRLPICGGSGPGGAFCFVPSQSALYKFPA